MRESYNVCAYCHNDFRIKNPSHAALFCSEACKRSYQVEQTWPERKRNEAEYRRWAMSMERRQSKKTARLI